MPCHFSMKRPILQQWNCVWRNAPVMLPASCLGKRSQWWEKGVHTLELVLWAVAWKLAVLYHSNKFAVFSKLEFFPRGMSNHKKYPSDCTLRVWPRSRSVFTDQASPVLWLLPATLAKGSSLFSKHQSINVSESAEIYYRATLPSLLSTEFIISVNNCYWLG